MIGADIGLYNSGRIYIFLHCVVQYIVFIEYLDKMRVGFLSDKDQRPAQHRHGYQHYERDLHIDRHRHDQREYDHDRRSCQ